MVENGSGAILGAEPIVLQFAHLGSSASAFETLEQGAHARLARARLKILAACDDVRTFDAQSPYLEQGETDGVGIAGAQRLGGIGFAKFPDISHRKR